MELDNKITFSFAKAKDFEQIRILLDEITENIREHKNWNNYKVYSETLQQKEIFKKILKSDSKLFIAKINNAIVGLINMQVILNLRHGWKRAHIEEFVIKKEFRRKGIGSKLLKETIKYCKKENIKVIKLMCGNQLDEAQKFYEKNGFEFKDKGYRLEI